MQQTLHFATLPQVWAGYNNSNHQRVNLYDFDGVLASPFEEALFTMDQTIHDAQFIAAVSERQGLNLSAESFMSQRYICLQAVLLRHGIDVEPGPVTPECGVPYHIITARCDRFAVARMHNYIDDNNLKPIKTMHLDHLEKGQMIQCLLDRHPDVRFSFWDDNPRHIQSALQLKSSRLTVHPVDNDMSMHYMQAKTFYINKILELVL